MASRSPEEKTGKRDNQDDRTALLAGNPGLSTAAPATKAGVTQAVPALSTCRRGRRPSPSPIEAHIRRLRGANPRFPGSKRSLSLRRGVCGLCRRLLSPRKAVRRPSRACSSPRTAAGDLRRRLLSLTKRACRTPGGLLSVTKAACRANRREVFSGSRSISKTGSALRCTDPSILAPGSVLRGLDPSLRVAGSVLRLADRPICVAGSDLRVAIPSTCDRGASSKALGAASRWGWTGSA